MLRVLVFTFTVLLAACAGAVPAGGAVPAPASSTIVFVVHAGALVPLACGVGAEVTHHGCLARLPAGASVRAGGRELSPGPAATTACGEPALAMPPGAPQDGALAIWPPATPVIEPGGVMTPAELAEAEAQLLRSDPLLKGPATADAKLSGDLDGDGAPDAAYAAGVPGLHALLVATTTFPGRLRLLQFSDLAPYAILGAVDLDPARPGRQLIVRTGGDLDVLRPNGEVVGGLHCVGK